MEPTVVGVISAVSELGITERRLVVTVVRDIRGTFFCTHRDRTIRKIVIFILHHYRGMVPWNDINKKLHRYNDNTTPMFHQHHVTGTVSGDKNLQD
jgi:hypothetical protein